MSLKPCFIILPGFAPDAVPTYKFKNQLELLGYQVIVSNFWGDKKITDFRQLTASDCLKGITAIIDQAKKDHQYLVGIGYSLGGALLIEYAKKYSKLDYLVSIGTPFKLKKRELISLGDFFLPIIYPIWHIFEKIKKLRLTPIGCTRMVVNFLEGDFLKNLEKVKTPIFFLHSKKDGVADYRAVSEFTKKFVQASREVNIFENGNHAINHDIKMILENVLNLIRLNEKNEKVN